MKGLLRKVNVDGDFNRIRFSDDTNKVKMLRSAVTDQFSPEPRQQPPPHCSQLKRISPRRRRSDPAALFF